jgi:hypothetical protein
MLPGTVSQYVLPKAECPGADLHLDRHFLLSVRRCERGLSHGQRDLPDRDQGRSSRGLLRDCPDLRCHRANLLWRADR